MESTQWIVVMPDGNRYGPANMSTIKAWVAEGRVSLEASLVDTQRGHSTKLTSVPGMSPPVAGQEADPLSSIIPYRNGPALLSYYVGLFSFIACVPFFGIIGIGMAVVAVVAGAMGLKRAAADRQAKGRVHCWVGLVCGTVFGLLGLAMNALALVFVLGEP